jgi:hypothetical protein
MRCRIWNISRLEKSCGFNVIIYPRGGYGGSAANERSDGCKTKLSGYARIMAKLTMLPCPGILGMYLSDHDLRQLDEAYLARLTPEQARALLSKALEGSVALISDRRDRTTAGRNQAANE